MSISLAKQIIKMCPSGAIVSIKAFMQFSFNGCLEENTPNEPDSTLKAVYQNCVKDNRPAFAKVMCYIFYLELLATSGSVPSTIQLERWFNLLSKAVKTDRDNFIEKNAEQDVKIDTIQSEIESFNPRAVKSVWTFEELTRSVPKFEEETVDLDDSSDDSSIPELETTITSDA